MTKSRVFKRHGQWMFKGADGSLGTCESWAWAVRIATENTAWHNRVRCPTCGA